MHPVAARLVENVRKNHQHLVPLLFAVFAAIANVHQPVQHQLLVASASWAIIFVPAVFRAGLRAGNPEPTRLSGWLAGALLALSQIWDRAASDREGIWATKALLPVLVILLSDNDRLSKYVLPTHVPSDQSPSGNNPAQGHTAHPRPLRLLVVIAVSASVVLSPGFMSSPTFALGISSAIFAAAGLAILGNPLKPMKDVSDDSKRRLMSANDSFSERSSDARVTNEQQLVVLRDVAATVSIACGIAAYFMEPRIVADSITWEPVYRELPGDWRTMQYHRTVRQVLFMIFVNAVMHVLMVLMICQQGAVNTSFLSLFSCMCAKLRLATTFSGIWFAIVYGSSALSFMTGSSSLPFVDIRSSVRIRRIIFGIMVLSIGLLFLRHVTEKYRSYHTHTDLPAFFTSRPETPYQPVPLDLGNGHPAAQLIDRAENDFENMLNKQSKTLGEAVQEYRRRYGIAPPPHFDKWYEFATRNGVVLVDEFDTVHQALLPYWALKPSTIRSRIRYALGHEDSALIGITIRDGHVVKVENGEQWVQQAITGMMKPFVEYLPDMDLGFNVHDEPRVIVPNDHLSAMVAKARDDVLPSVSKNQSPRNAFSQRPPDMNDGKRFAESSNTRFNRFAHQQTWTHSRLSCPADSQAQKFEDQIPDNLTAYAATPLNYIYNLTAFSDICNSPSLSSSFGFFERPNAFNVIHELTPVFSPSKISSFQDLLYPSPWYWFGKVGYDDSHDTTWENKTNSLYWRGSTTGGFSRHGGWRRQHRQRIVRRLTAPDQASIFVPSSTSPPPAHSLETIDRKLYRSLVNVKFSHIGQCDPGDCDAQKEFFEVTDRVDGQNAWYFKHLLDMDGNAFSGRFYSFLRSRSLTYKMALFREWHSEWLRPWVHYVPLSLIGDEYLDVLRWFAGGDAARAKEADGKPVEATKGGNGDSEGERKAREIAERSTEWAEKALRNVDFEAWFFRLLLEYGRVVDDERENIGYAGP